MALFSGLSKKKQLPSAAEALPGRSQRMPVASRHFVLGSPMEPPYAENTEMAMFAMGCFWGAERGYWETPGVHSTAVGYAAGMTPNPTYHEVCTGGTGHTEAVRVVFDPDQVSYGELLRIFWEGHDPTQGMQQGNDVGTQYRSGIYTYGEDQQRAAVASSEAFQKALSAAGRGEITSEILEAPEFYYAEDDHQQYLAKVPGGYCGLGGTGVRLPEDATI